MSNILEIKNLHKKYHTKKEEIIAIDNISLNVNEGEYLSVVGPSGCGKSTLLSIIGNIEKPTNGKIISKKNLKIGYMLQVDCLFPWLKVLDNALLGLKLKNELSKENIMYVKKLLETYGLGDFLDSYPNNLSGGMRQRVACIK